jgi:hypothetical protein
MINLASGSIIAYQQIYSFPNAYNAAALLPKLEQILRRIFSASRRINRRIVSDATIDTTAKKRKNTNKMLINYEQVLRNVHEIT